jgi:chemotaxis protein MotB
MARKPRVEEEDEGPDKAWIESWADAMTLLMAFFVMLFAFALVDETKFADFKVGMVTALGVADPVLGQADSILENGDGIALTVGLTTTPDPANVAAIEAGKVDLEGEGSITVDNVEDVRDLLEAKFIENGAAEFVSVDIDERGVVVRYDGRVLFRSGSAELSVDSDVILAATAEVLQLVDNGVDIEGHTDDVPTGGRWISNWELSGARAAAVVRWMESFGSIPSRRLAAVGMGETRPLVPNDSDENRAQNRRVEVVIRVADIVEAGIDVIDPIGDPIGDPIIESSPLGESAPDPPVAEDAPIADTPVDDASDVPAPIESNDSVLGAVGGNENVSNEE